MTPVAIPPQWPLLRGGQDGASVEAPVPRPPMAPDPGGGGHGPGPSPTICERRPAGGPLAAPPMPLRALFLDVGETLVTTVPSRFEIYARAARVRGVEVTPDAMQGWMRAAHDALPEWIEGSYRYSDPWFERFIQRIFGAELGFGAADVEAITEELFARFEAPESYRVFPGARELFDAARDRGLVLGVVSNWSARLPRVLEGIELVQHFDFVLSSAIEGAEKPDAELFRRALERAGVAPGEALHAGDHRRLDVRGALEAGLQAVRVDHTGRAERTPCEPSERCWPTVHGLPALASAILERCP